MKYNSRTFQDVKGRGSKNPRDLHRIGVAAARGGFKLSRKCFVSRQRTEEGGGQGSSSLG